MAPGSRRRGDTHRVGEAAPAAIQTHAARDARQPGQQPQQGRAVQGEGGVVAADAQAAGDLEIGTKGGAAAANIPQRQAVIQAGVAHDRRLGDRADGQVDHGVGVRFP